MTKAQVTMIAEEACVAQTRGCLRILNIVLCYVCMLSSDLVGVYLDLICVFKASCLSLSLTGWNELLIASFSHRSISVKDGILLATGLHVHRNSAHSAGVGAIFDR